MPELHFISYHNPDSMGYGFREINQPCVSTNKAAAADQAEIEAIIWCIGREGKRYYLYGRLVDTRLKKETEGYFKYTLCGKETFPQRHTLEITDQPYLPQVKKLVSLGLQRLTDQSVISAFKAEYERVQAQTDTT